MSSENTCDCCSVPCGRDDSAGHGQPDRPSGPRRGTRIRRQPRRYLNEVLEDPENLFYYETDDPCVTLADLDKDPHTDEKWMEQREEDREDEGIYWSESEAIDSDDSMHNFVVHDEDDEVTDSGNHSDESDADFEEEEEEDGDDDDTEDECEDSDDPLFDDAAPRYRQEPRVVTLPLPVIEEETELDFRATDSVTVGPSSGGSQPQIRQPVVIVVMPPTHRRAPLTTPRHTTNL